MSRPSAINIKTAWAQITALTQQSLSYTTWTKVFTWLQQSSKMLQVIMYKFKAVSNGGHCEASQKNGKTVHAVLVILTKPIKAEMNWNKLGCCVCLKLGKLVSGETRSVSPCFLFQCPGQRWAKWELYRRRKPKVRQGFWAWIKENKWRHVNKFSFHCSVIDLSEFPVGTCVVTCLISTSRRRCEVSAASMFIVKKSRLSLVAIV